MHRPVRSIRASGVIVAALVGVVSGCATQETQKPDEADASGLHLVSHERGACRLCDLYHEAKGYVVRILTDNGLGAGVVITSDGLIATNAHVVRPAKKVRVETFEDRELPGIVVAEDSTWDLALVRVESTELRWTPVAIEAGSPAPVGSEVYAIGHPLGLGWTVTRGIVSGYRQAGDVRLIQTDAPISPGNSGGPLLDKEGHLIGVVTAKILGGGAESVAFALPVSALLEFLRREMPKLR